MDASLAIEHTPPGASRRRAWIGVISLGLGLTVAVWLFWRSRSAPASPVLFSLPAFSLVDERGQPFGSAELAGRPYVADFVYTSCHDACPMLTARMGELQDALRRDPAAVQLVTFTVDPARDGPTQLAEYARSARAIPGLWHFLTGPVGHVTSLLQDGFKVSMEGGPAGDVTHDNHFVLVDARGRIRGYFEASPSGLRGIRSALKNLLLGD